MRSKIAALLSLAIAIPALALTLAGVNMEDHATVGGQTLVLNGAGLRKKLFIKVYVGGLYLPAKNSNAAAIMAADTPRRQVMHFLYSVSKSQMCDAWDEGLEDNTKNPTTVEVNGKAKGTLPGKPTADAILATWIGPKPGPGQDFKKAVLGK